MKKIYKENLLGKYALLFALDCAFDLNRGLGTDLWYPQDTDRLEFTFDGHKCRLLSIDEMDYKNSTITMVVLAKGKELKEWTDIRLCFEATHFRFETLRKIVVEFYMCSNACDNDTWADDVDSFIKDKCADWFDSYDSQNKK